jgi:hypothetical protein
MKKIKLMALLIFLTQIIVTAQNDSFDSNSPHNDAGSNNGSEIYNPQIEAMWDVLLQFDATVLNGSTGNAGAEWNGTYFYSTRWASNLIHEYNATGTTLLREFSIPGVTGLRDLAFDGTNFYGGAAGNLIYQMDFAAGTLIGTITTTEAVRHISYDSDQDAFWVGNWATDIVAIDRSGNELARIPASTHGLTNIYGSCYDNKSTGGPYLWVFTQGSGAGTPQYIIQLQLPNGTPTGVAHDVISDVGAGNTDAIGGGLFSMTDFSSGFFTIGGLLQGAPIADLMFVYEIGSTTSVQNEGEVPNVFNLEQNHPNPFNPTTNIRYSIPKAENVKLAIYNLIGEEIGNLVNEYQQAGTYNLTFNANNLPSGIYFYSIIAGNFVETKKMILLK